jgi:glycosyltransferase involved in cell wall biosynthesis
MERANGIQTAETVHALARRGYEVQLCVRRTDARDIKESLAFYGLPEHARLTVRRLPVPRRGARLAFLLRALAAVLRSAPDVVYTRDLGVAYAALRFRFLHRRPVVYEAIAMATTFREEAPALYQGARPPGTLRRLWQNHVERTVTLRADAVIATTSHLMSALETAFGKPRLGAIVPNGARVPQERPPLPPARDPSKVYYLGQLYPWKGADLLVDAMGYLPGASLVIVGGLAAEPDLDRLKKKVAALGFSDRVFFRGYLAPPDLPAEREKAEVVVIPHAESRTAREFTSPLKLFEALAAGRPIVATDLPSVREILTHGENALLVPPGDPRQLAAAIQTVLADRALAERLASGAFETARHYSWEARAEKIDRVLQGVRQGSG